jgi:hypothetical protein
VSKCIWHDFLGITAEVVVFALCLLHMHPVQCTMVQSKYRANVQFFLHLASQNFVLVGQQQAQLVSFYFLLFRLFDIKFATATIMALPSLLCFPDPMVIMMRLICKPTCLQPLPNWLLGKAVKNKLKRLEANGSIPLTSIGIMIKPRMQFKRIIGDPFHASMIECLNDFFVYHGGLLRI